MKKKLAIFLIYLIWVNAGVPASNKRTGEKRYRNKVYGFSVAIPEKVTLEVDDPPLPQHGCGLVISKDPQAVIWVGADYNAAEWESLSEAQMTYFGFLKKHNQDLEKLSQKPTYLYNLKALRSSSRYKDTNTGQMMREELLIAFRRRKGQIAVVYRVQMRTPELAYERNSKIYEETIKTFRLEHMP